MFGDFKESRIHVKPGATDLRKSINGLSIVAEEGMKKKAMSGDIFVFCNRNRNRLKVLYWQINGFCLWLKRLEQDKIPWPRTEEEALEITHEEFSWLLKGIDFWRAYKKISYSRVL